jgi:Amt family ammonium transporter
MVLTVLLLPFGLAAAASLHGRRGRAAVGVWFVTSLIVWVILKAVMGLRVSQESEVNGLDVSELGMEAYPDFTKG